MAKEGFLSYREYKQGFIYIQKDSRFKVFSASGIKHHKILELDDDGYIIPQPDVICKLISSEDIPHIPSGGESGE